MRCGKKFRVFTAVIIAVIAVGVIFAGRMWEKNYSVETQRETLLHELESIGEYEESTVILRNIEEKEAKALADKYGAKVRASADKSFFVLMLPDNVSINDIIANDENLKYIDNIELDYYVSLEELPEVPYNAELLQAAYATAGDHFPYIEFENAHEVTRGQGIGVAIIDTGIDYDHSAFNDTNISTFSYNASTDEVVDYSLKSDGSYDLSIIKDKNGHGTAVAGIIAEIAPEAELYIIKIEPNAQGELQSSHIEFALTYVLDNCYRYVNVLNMSLGIYNKPLY